MLSRSALLGVVGGVLLLGGLALGLSDSTISDTATGEPSPGRAAVSCGSPWQPDLAAARREATTIGAQEAELRCHDAHGMKGWLALALVAIGGGAVMAAWLTKGR